VSNVIVFGEPPGKFARLAKEWARLLARDFTHAEAATVTKQVLGGQIMRSIHGHEFLLVEDRFIFDFWGTAHYDNRPVYEMERDAEEIAVLFGVQESWEAVSDDSNATSGKQEKPQLP
jgi:hypothetical protein